MATFDELWATIMGLKPHFSVIGSQSPPGEDEIDSVGEKLGVKFPRAYKMIARNVAALHVEAKPEVWPEPKVGDVGPAWRFIRGFDVYATGDDVPDFLDIEEVTAELRDETKLSWVPFAARIGSADRFCFLPDGTIVEWDHELSADEQDVTPVSRSVYDLLMKEAAELAKNLKRIRRQK